MTKEWVDAKNAKYAAKFEGYPQKIIDYYNGLDQELRKIIDPSNKFLNTPPEQYNVFVAGADIHKSLYEFRHNGEKDFDFVDSVFDTFIDMLECYHSYLLCAGDAYSNLQDTQLLHYNGDIIITDPCYIIREKHHGTVPITEDDWDTCDCGYEMEALGINTYLTHDTLYGDWGCTTFDMNTKQPIGKFCADSGLVSVFQLDEVLKYNPEYDYHIKKNWTTTLIKDFCGNIQIKIKQENGVYEDDFELNGRVCWRKGDEWTEYVCYVEGHGVNKVTGEPIDFITSQTGL